MRRLNDVCRGSHVVILYAVSGPPAHIDGRPHRMAGRIIIIVAGWSGWVAIVIVAMGIG